MFVYGIRLYSVVVVIDCEGGYWFLYIGYLFKLGLELCGICIDVLLNILVCDDSIFKVYIFDKNGWFFLYLFMNLFLVFELCSLGYDFNIYCFWIGLCFNNDVCIYNYIIW